MLPFVMLAMIYVKTIFGSFDFCFFLRCLLIPKTFRFVLE